MQQKKDEKCESFRVMHHAVLIKLQKIKGFYGSWVMLS